MFMCLFNQYTVHALGDHHSSWIDMATLHTPSSSLFSHGRHRHRS